jgi:hypothetical protein
MTDAGIYRCPSPIASGPRYSRHSLASSDVELPSSYRTSSCELANVTLTSVKRTEPACTSSTTVGSRSSETNGQPWIWSPFARHTVVRHSQDRSRSRCVAVYAQKRLLILARIRESDLSKAESAFPHCEQTLYRCLSKSGSPSTSRHHAIYSPDFSGRWRTSLAAVWHRCRQT